MSRVKDFGEVFTPPEVVNDMLNIDGLREYTYDINKTFLEPSVGQGVFLLEILKRRLERVDTEEEIKKAVSTLYGVEIQRDNRDICVENILNLIAEYTTVTEELKSIVDKNIICGNYLENIDEDGNELVFYEWLDDGYKIHKAADI